MKQINLKSPLCVGLDPIIEFIPEVISDNLRERIYIFLTKVIDLSSTYTNFFKIQKAFLDEYDFGNNLLKEVIVYAKSKYPDSVIVVDCKIGDVEHTLKSYTKNLFSNLNADGIVVNPYMGSDVFDLFKKFPYKLFLVLIRTSNPGAKIIQDVKLENGEKLWFYILKKTIEFWKLHNNIIPIISLEDNTKDYSKVSAIIPNNMKIFWAGYGYQNKTIDLLHLIQNKDKNRILINSSRGILYNKINDSKKWELQILKNLSNTIKDLKKSKI